MCYQYKLHEYKHKEGLKKQLNDDKITLSIQICNDDDSANGVVSDFLKKVNLYNNDIKDTYYVDDTHFYYVKSGNKNNEDEIIELCFSPNDLESDNDAKIVTETEYCIKHNNDDKLCSKRGVYITDICGLQSMSREEYHSPSSDIDYIPVAGQFYKLRHVYFCFFYI